MELPGDLEPITTGEPVITIPCLSSALTKIFVRWHCDLKPANILFCKEGQYKGWKIADPGFAKFVKEGNARIQDGLPVILNTGGTSEYGK